MSRLVARAGNPLRGTCRVPGDKSISHRSLILGGMAVGESRITGLLEGQDVLDTARAVAALGAEVERTGEGAWRITGAEWRSPDAVIDCGNSGTGVRLLMGAVAGHDLSATFTGDESLRGRPMKRVLDPLRDMGARFEGDDRLPIIVHGGRLTGTSFVNAKASAQVKSAILLAGLRADGAVEVIEPRPSRDHSERMLRAFGAEVEVELQGAGWAIRLGSKRSLGACDVAVPGDPSSAAFPLVAALIVPSSDVTVTGILLNPLRTGLLATLEEMGADLTISNRREVGGEEVGDITARHSALRGVTVPAERAPSMIDEYPVLAVAAAFAEGTTVMQGLDELRVKESDRLAAIATGLRGCGVRADEGADSLTVEGGAPEGGAIVATHGDHRIAMSFLVMGLAARREVAVDRPDMIDTSFPGFAGLMRGLGADMKG